MLHWAPAACCPTARPAGHCCLTCTGPRVWGSLKKRQREPWSRQAKPQAGQELTEGAIRGLEPLLEEVHFKREDQKVGDKAIQKTMIT